MISMGDGDVVLKNYEGKIFTYPDPSSGAETIAKSSSEGDGVCSNPRESASRTIHPGMIDEAR